MTLSKFSSLGIKPAILKTIQNLGYEAPTPIQAICIPALLSGKNLLGTAQTGTGKTAAFALPMLSQMDNKQKTPQILVLTPTRELAIQVAEAFQRYARNIKNFHVLPIYGGADLSVQLRGLKRSTQVVVGTPGRILDHLRRRSLNLTQIKTLVLDEADEMLRMGFIDDVEKILAQTPTDCQRALFSATMPERIRNIAETYLGDAQHVSISAKTKTVEQIKQSYLMLKSHQKLDALTRILEVEPFDGMLIFVRTKSATLEIAEKLEARGYTSAALNGDLSQSLRERTIKKLRQGLLDIVVATDVAARGLDVNRISHVINYDVPYDNESYVHRIGRTGRAGREGTAIILVTQKENRLLRAIEKSTRQKIIPFKLPSNSQVSDLRIQQITEELMRTSKRPELTKFRALVDSIGVQNGLDATEIAAILLYERQKDRPIFPTKIDFDFQQSATSVKQNFKQQSKSTSASGENRTIDPSKSQNPSKQKVAKKKRKKNLLENSRVSSNIEMLTYRVELGLEDGITAANIVGAIANEADIDSRYIGQIKLQKEFCTVQLPAGMPSQLLGHLRKVKIRQKELKISLLNT
ncbi:MAG: ATP-dependent RNA helicase [Cellvibrionales bacterium TMED49]|nr:ATP-dependent RNA helicase [Porticoccaceae bacterium]OUU38492.1 MAG: ATP-dependent RNA helicase [Cellvibrionales bacterium TMED49]